MKQHNSYTNEQLEWLKSNYPKMQRGDLTLKFNNKFDANRTQSAIISTCKRNKFKSGRSGYFHPDHKPWNTGTKGICKPNSGSFKKGQRPENWKPVGHERLDKDGYILVKVKEPNVFRHKARVIWELFNGKIDDKFVLAYIDGDRSNCNIHNLELISKNEHLQRNRLQITNAHKEVRPTLKLIAKLQATTSEKLNGN